MIDDIIITPTSYVVHPRGEPIFGERAITVQLIDEGAGEYLQIVSHNGNTVEVDPEEWDVLFRAGRMLIEGSGNE